MFNELLFISESILVSLFAVGALLFGSAGLFAFISVSWVVGCLFVLKEVSFLGLSVITSDVFAVGCDLGITLLREYYGEKEAKRAIVLGMSSILYFLIVSQLFIWYIPTAHDTINIHAIALFTPMIRIILTSIAVAIFSKSLNLYLLNLLTKLWGDRYFKLKTTISLCTAQFFDTILFSFIALYGTVESVWSIIGFSYAVKCLSIFICVPLVITLHTFIRKRRGI